MRRCLLLILVSILWIAGLTFADSSNSTNPWEDVELSAFDLIQEGYRLIGVVWPDPNIEGMYFQKKNKIYRCFTLNGPETGAAHDCEILRNVPRPVLAKAAFMLLATAQENYYAKNDSYTSDLEALKRIGFFYPNKIGIKITHADKNSWRGIAFFIEFPKVEYVYDSAKGGLQN